MKLLIGADLVPTASNQNLFVQGDKEALVGKELSDLLQQADYRIFNLEVPLTDTPAPSEKFGPSLIAPTATVAGCRAMGIDLLTLSNNHILDQGASGLRSTMEVLKKQGISYVGAGEDRKAASAPYCFTFAKKRIGVYACCEHEFSVATENSPGANPFDPLESLDHIASLKQECDYVIVLYHGGREHYRYPAPYLRKVCRKLIEKGANLVVCQQSHCIGCEEKYGEGTIVYGQGNFLFDYENNEFSNTGLLIQLSNELELTYVPLVKTGNGVRIADEQQADRIMQNFNERSEEIKQAGVVEEKYKEVAIQQLPWFMRQLSGRKSFVYKAASKLTGYRLDCWALRRRYKKENLLAVQNLIHCEAYRELLLTALDNK